MKIDIVYLWVDGADSVWKDKNRKALAMLGRALPPDSATLNRFQDNDELKYSLRSLEKFAPWINHIYIITDNQRPAWLADDPFVTIVDHTEIIPKKYLPVFNASAIELFLHKVPGLSEHFLFANDDTIFGAPAAPDFFFDKDGKPIVIVKGLVTSSSVFGDDKTYAEYTGKKTLAKTLIRNGVRFAYKKTGRKYNAYLAHGIEPMRKSALKSLMAEFGDELIETTCTKFREVSNVQRIANLLIANARGQNTMKLNWRVGRRRIPYRHGGSLLAMFWTIAQKLFYKLGIIKYDVYDKERNVTRDIRKFRPTIFCINDLSEAKNMFLENIDLMNEFFPEKSRFEK